MAAIIASPILGRPGIGPGRAWVERRRSNTLGLTPNIFEPARSQRGVARSRIDRAEPRWCVREWYSLGQSAPGGTRATVRKTDGEGSRQRGT
jgi:hypothetical protein